MTKAQAKVTDKKPLSATGRLKRSSPRQQTGPVPIRSAAPAMLSPSNEVPTPVRAVSLLSRLGVGTAPLARMAAHLQHSVGNARLGRMISSESEEQSPAARTQPGLPGRFAVSHPNSPSEKEAEAVAHTVTAGQQPPRITPTGTTEVGTLSRLAGDEGSTGAEAVQRAEKEDEQRALPAERPVTAVPNRAAVIQAIAQKGPGAPLNPATRTRMEREMGADFSHTRVHKDSAAHEAADTLNARAFTHGNDIFLARGESEHDTHLMAHELTHVVQQGSAPQSERMIQRYVVPGDLPCRDVVPWLDANSPYSPEWAQTSCNYTFNGKLKISPPKPVDGGVELTVKGHGGLTVSVSCPVDRPEWSPSKRPNQKAEIAAWKGMRATLDAHESQHRKIGEQWRAILEKRFRAVDFTVKGVDKEDAMDKVREKLAADQEHWKADAQKAQDAIDPFKGALLNCP
jgi:hypothetical protein